MSADPRLLIDLTVAVAAGLLGALAARAARLPVLAGYLLAGVVLGPSGFGVLRDSEVIGVMAELGVTLLMFAIGVELSLGWLGRMRPAALIAAPVQIIATVGLGYGLSRYMGWEASQGIILGFVLALSSTMVVVKLLAARGELHTLHGQVTVAILLVQDLAVVLMVALLPVLSGVAGARPLDLAAMVAKGLGFVLWIFVLARWVVPAIMRVVATSYSKEVFVVTTAAVCLGGAVSGYFLGFSLALGAFAAGLVVSESEYGYEMLADVTPLRDLFGMVFFVSLGLLSDIRAVWSHLDWAVLLLLAVLVGKPVITAAATVLSKYHARTAITAGLGLAQIGEFSFLVATLAWQQGLLTDELHSLVIAVATLSLLGTPIFMRLGGLLYSRMRAQGLGDDGIPSQSQRRRKAAGEPLTDHVILCGYGRVGHLVGEVLLEERHPFVVIDYDQHIVAGLKSREVPVLYGDASSRVLLDAAGAAGARLAVVALPEGISTRLAVRGLRRVNPSLPIVARVHLSEEVEATYREGATEVVYAEFEASLEMMRHTLLSLEREPDRVQALVDAVRRDRYRPLRQDQQEG